MIEKINCLKDVRAFAEQLVREQVIFHPDEDFNSYINLRTALPAYSESEARHRNTLMRKCFTICAENNVCIYELMHKIANIERKRLGYSYIDNEIC